MSPVPDTLLKRIAESLIALDAAAKQLTLAAIAIGFPHSTHLIYAHLPNRAVTLGRLLCAGGQPLGIVGYAHTTGGPDPYYTVFPETPGLALAREHLRTLARGLAHRPLRCYVLHPGAPGFREPWTGTLATLLIEARQTAASFEHPRLVFALDEGPRVLAVHSPSFEGRLKALLAVGGSPVGIVGYRKHNEAGIEESTQESGTLLTQYADSIWTKEYLDSLLEVLTRIRWASGGDRRLVQPTERPGSERTPRELLAALDLAAAELNAAALVLILDDSADAVVFDNPGRATLLERLLQAGGTPVGITGYVIDEVARRTRFEIFSEYAHESWAVSYLQGLTDRLQVHLDDSAYLAVPRN